MSGERSWLRISLCTLMLSLSAGLHAQAQQINWRYDYNAARQEARAKNLPIFMDFGKRDCLWCAKLDKTTFQDANIARTLSQKFIPVKLDGEKYAKLVRDLQIKGFPCIVIAAPAGQILDISEGYIPANNLQMKLDQTLVRLGTPTTGSSDIMLAKHTAEAPPPTAPAAPPLPPKSMNMNSTASNRAQMAAKLLAMAEEEYASQQLICCLIRCKTIAATFTDLPEAEKAQQLMNRIKSDPKHIELTCRKLADSLCEMYVHLAEENAKAGQIQQAKSYLQWVVQVCPDTPTARTAREMLDRLESGSATTTTTPPTPPSGTGPELSLPPR